MFLEYIFHKVSLNSFIITRVFARRLPESKICAPVCEPNDIMKLIFFSSLNVS